MQHHHLRIANGALWGVALVVLVGTLYFAFHEQVAAPSISGGVPSGGTYGAEVLADAVTFRRDGHVVSTVTLKDAAAKFSNYDPAHEYRFFDPVIDDAHNAAYFTVFDITTGGNVNVEQVMFRYDLVSKRLQPLKQETGVPTGFIPSPDGRYVLLVQGWHGGACSNLQGLFVFDLAQGKEVGSVMPRGEAGGAAMFKEWRGATEFVYTEESFATEEDCRRAMEGEGEPARAEKTFRISGT